MQDDKNMEGCYTLLFMFGVLEISHNKTLKLLLKINVVNYSEAQGPLICRQCPLDYTCFHTSFLS